MKKKKLFTKRLSCCFLEVSVAVPFGEALKCELLSSSSLEDALQRLVTPENVHWENVDGAINSSFGAKEDVTSDVRSSNSSRSSSSDSNSDSDSENESRNSESDSSDDESKNVLFLDFIDIF